MVEYCDVSCHGSIVAGGCTVDSIRSILNADNCKVVPGDLEIVKPMPLVGLYAALASLICTLGMAADAIHGFRSKKLWFPCKFFGLNAATLTLLAVGTKLSVDLSTQMLGLEDQLAKLSTTIFLSIAMGNSLTSLGSMDNQSILTNVTALVIFVFTVGVNMSIQILNNLIKEYLYLESILATIIMLVLVLLLVSSALSVPTTKKYIEAKYQEVHRIASKDQEEERRKFTTEDLKYVVRKYWVMAATGNPQFVMARSATCTNCGAICLLIAVVLAEAVIRVHITELYYPPVINSDYQWSTFCILAFQVLGIVVGTIAPILRWFTAVNFQCSEEGSKSCKNELKIETYWTQRLNDWQESSLPLFIRGIKFRKLVHTTRCTCLRLSIIVQTVVVLASKCVVLLSICLLKLFLLLLFRIGKTKVESEFKSPASTDQTEQESEPGQELNSYVLLLEGEVGLPRRTLKKIFYEVDQLILTGKNEQPKFLIKLLEKSSNYHGVTDFDSDQVPSLHSEEPPNCWSLPVATLASIAIMIPKIQKDEANQLLKSIRQGLRYASLIDKHQKTKEDSVILSNAADVVWAGVELHYKWLDKDLGCFKGKTSREILEEFAKIAKSSIADFKKNGKLMKNPINWHSKAIAAYSMYRISGTLLLAYEGDNDLTDEELFDKLSVMIADIFSACFISLPRLIITKCHCDEIENRETSVRQAALLLGESEEILEILQQRDISSIIPNQVAYVDEWRALIKERNPPASNSSLSNGSTYRQSSETDAVIDIKS